MGGVELQSSALGNARGWRSCLSKKQKKMSHRTSLVLPVFLCPLNPQFLVTAGERTWYARKQNVCTLDTGEVMKWSRLRRFPEEQRHLRSLHLMQNNVNVSFQKVSGTKCQQKGSSWTLKLFKPESEIWTDDKLHWCEWCGLIYTKELLDSGSWLVIRCWFIFSIHRFILKLLKTFLCFYGNSSFLSSRLIRWISLVVIKHVEKESPVSVIKLYSNLHVVAF